MNKSIAQVSQVLKIAYHEVYLKVCFNEALTNKEREFLQLMRTKQFLSAEALLNLEMEDITYEYCPHCENEVILKNEFVQQECPVCHEPIKPCSICDSALTTCSKNCPLDIKTFTYNN